MAQGFLAYGVDLASYFVVCREESRELRCFALTLLLFWGRTTLKPVIVPSKTNSQNDRYVYFAAFSTKSSVVSSISSPRG